MVALRRWGQVKLIGGRSQQHAQFSSVQLHCYNIYVSRKSHNRRLIYDGCADAEAAYGLWNI